MCTYNFKKYYSFVRKFIHDIHLIADSLDPSPDPFEVDVDENDNIIGVKINEKIFSLKNGDHFKIYEEALISGEQIEIIQHKYQFSPSNPDKNKGWWFFRIDLDQKAGLHGNHNDGKGNYYDSKWEHHLIPRINLSLDIQYFNLFLFMNLVTTYCSQKTKYPFDKAHAKYYNKKISTWRKKIL